jgi:hypothetical protein
MVNSEEGILEFWNKIYTKESVLDVLQTPNAIYLYFMIVISLTIYVL